MGENQKPNTKAYEEGHDRIFGKDKSEAIPGDVLRELLNDKKESK